MNCGIEARLDGSQHIAVETQGVMAMHLHIYYFISAFRIPVSHKPALSVSPLLSLPLFLSHIHTQTHTETALSLNTFTTIKLIKSNAGKKKKCLYAFLQLEFWRPVFEANRKKKCK